MDTSDSMQRMKLRAFDLSERAVRSSQASTVRRLIDGSSARFYRDPIDSCQLARLAAFVDSSKDARLAGVLLILVLDR
jgi:hypothetical protein